MQLNANTFFGVLHKSKNNLIVAYLPLDQYVIPRPNVLSRPFIADITPIMTRLSVQGPTVAIKENAARQASVLSHPTLEQHEAVGK